MNFIKTWKIITIVGAVLVATALVKVSAFAYMGGRGFSGPCATSKAAGTYGIYSGGMMNGGMGRVMGGYGYPQTGTQPAYPNQYGIGGCLGTTGYTGTATN